jgi:aminoglycoside 2'-N-acetyltransferase I
MQTCSPATHVVREQASDGAHAGIAGRLDAIEAERENAHKDAATEGRPPRTRPRRTYTLLAVQVGARPYRDVEPNDLEEWKQLARRAHPPGAVRLGSDLHWADLDPETDYLIRVWDDDELRACGWVTQRTVSVAGHETAVAGIRGVVTDPDHRRRGYGRAVMEKAHEVMRSFADVEFALLFSSVMAVPFYEDLGWRTIHGPVTCDQPGGRIDYTETLPTAPVMVLGLRPLADLPRGPVAVRGLPW